MERVAVYRGPKNVSGERVAAALKKLRIPFAFVSPDDIAAGRLAEFAAVIFPGGHSIALGAAGVREVKRYVDSGGGLLGICAGAQFAMRARLIPVRWKALRASGIFDMRVVAMHPITRGYAVAGKHPSGRPWRYSNRGRVRVRYCNGGILRAGKGVVTVVSFDEAGAMGAIVAGTSGRGRVVLVTPHPESTPAPKDCGMFVSDAENSQDPLRLVANAVRWACARNAGRS